MVFLILLGLLALRGFLKGFTGEFFSIASLALGLIGAVFFFKNGASFLRDRYFQGTALLPEVLAFLGILFLVFAAGKILERIVTDIIRRLNLDRINRALGLILGLAEALALISISILFLTIQPLFNAEGILGESRFAALLLPLIGVFRV
jgi:membrane protein required for colicin V production